MAFIIVYILLVIAFHIAEYFDFYCRPLWESGNGEVSEKDQKPV